MAVTADTDPAPDAGFRAPTISLPKGGGAIRGVGEKFAANPVTGTGSMSVPIATSPGRSGFGPQLTLAYDSGAGNGPFGFGWSLSLPSITRKTDKGLPRFADSQESDVFVLSGAEDLVPVHRQDPEGTWIAGRPGFQRDAEGFWVRDPSGRLVVHEDDLDGYRVRRYRPRIEGLFARIERWTKLGTRGDVHWRSISGDNILTIYGSDANSRIADPLDPGRIFSWSICQTRDDKGNGVLYRYRAEDALGVDHGRAHERNRGPGNDPRRTANRYIKRIHYGNRTPLLDAAGARPRFLDEQRVEAQIAAGDWMFEVVFDYGDHDATAPEPEDYRATDAAGALRYPWKRRPDPFSTYRSGFEIRTTRLCRRVLMFHHFLGEAGVGRDCLVRSTDLSYSDDVDPSAVHDPVYAFLQAVTQSGYRRENGGYFKRSLPPAEFEYTRPEVQDVVQELDPESLENLPGGVERWADLHGEGIAGILIERAGGWFYKRNLSPIEGQTRARFGALEAVALKPNVALGGGAELVDLAGDGQPDVVVADGLYEHDDAEGWHPFRAFTSALNRDLHDPNVQLVDLDGDGHADVLVTEDDALLWHASLAEDGFGPARRVPQALDEEKGPRVVFADGTQSIFLADLSGDGLTDLVRIRNGEVCYWPNLGYGQFGDRVTMDDAPVFDRHDQFDHSRIRLADIDGSGTTDIIYLHGDGPRLYFNQSGNAWSPPQLVKAFPQVDDVASVVPTDLLGNGTACLVWSSPLPGEARQQVRYVNLMGRRKPHLLVKATNNLGAETRIDYAPSTKFYLQDKRDGHPWITRLPFPVHVVERVETFDHVGRNRFVARYAYHHGFFDGSEREFRGFGMVEQWDTEAGAAGAENVDEASDVPPVYTRSWFHTGAYLGREKVSRHFEHEYFRELTIEASRPLLLDDTDLPTGLTAEDEGEACRALKGAMLRQEVYADDAGPGATAKQVQRAGTPYTVTEQSFSVRALQPKGSNRHAVFLSHPREAITYRYERNPADPRIQHMLTLEVDPYGKVLKEATIGYGRRTTIGHLDPQGQVQQAPNPGLAALDAADQARQTAALLTYTEHRLTNAVESAEAHRTPLPCEAVTFELTGYPPSGPAGRFVAADFVEPDPNAVGRLRHKVTDEVAYEAAPSGNPCRRPIQWLRTLYRRDGLSGLLPLGELSALALPGEAYKLAFTPGLLTQVFQRPRAGQPPQDLLPVPAAVLASRGGYVQSQTLKADGRFPAADPDGHWWIPTGRSFLSTNPADDPASELAEARQHFFLPRRYRDPFGQDAVVDFDGNDMLMAEIRDALGNRVTVVANDFRVLQPRLVSDPNRNETEVAFDTVGMVVATAVRGKAAPVPAEGDTLAGFAADLSQSQLDAFFDAPDPRAGAQTLLRGATTRIVYDLDRFRRTQQANPDDPARWRPACAATLARETHASAPLPAQGLKIQLSLSYSDGFGREIQQKLAAEPGAVTEEGETIDPRWISSGWTIFNNKGKPVRTYEPFFSATHRFEFGVQAGVSTVVFYDPAERVNASLFPNHTFEKVVFDAWQQTTYDVNDTCATRNAQTGDPRSDPDIGGYVAGHFAALPPAWETWLAQRNGGLLGPDEQDAALRAAAHADTPTTVWLDALGRPFLTAVRNRVSCAGHDLDGTEATFLSRVELDIEGNERAVRDADQQGGDPLGRVVMTYAYDLLGTRIQQRSMEAGARWMLTDVAGKSIRAWDSRGHDFTTAYDALGRPVEQYVRGTMPASDPRTLNRDVLVDRIEYGEGQVSAEALNLRTRVYRHFDCAGVATSARLDANGDPVEAYDFKGNLLRSTRRLLSDYTAVPDWQGSPRLEAETFESATRYDALNRPVQSIAPHSSLAATKLNVTQPAFNDANLLQRVDVWLERATEPTGLLDPAVNAPSGVGVAGIEYDAQGQRRHIDYCNGATTAYDYDPLTFRLRRLYTRRGAAFTEDCDNPQPPPATMAAPGTAPARLPCGVQNLTYTYDPAGNVTHIRDDAQQIVFFRNQRIEPSNDYTYDAAYRLIQATGREHLGQQAGGARNPPTAYDGFDATRIRQDHPNVLKAMGAYVERYVYDAVGNFVEMHHRGTDPVHPGWARGFNCAEASLIEDGTGGMALKTSNRLTATTVNALSEPYAHDAHGNVVHMPHLGGVLPGPNLLWDYQDRLRQTVLGGGGTAYHVYDASGQRVRKVWEKAPGLIEERIYIGAFEIFRKHGGAIGANTATLERETLHVTDDKQRVAVVETRTLDIAGNDPAPRQSIRYQLGNHLGSACLELDDQAQIISYEEYSPYGDSTYQAVRSQTETPKRYRYTGKERDEESGFYYYGARYCAPWLGRWVSCDPAGVTHSPNLFAAMDCNPIVLIDPTGCQSELFLTHRGPSLLPSLVPEPVSPSLSPRDRYSAIPNLADSTPQEPPSNLSKFRATVRSMGTQGLPVNLLNTVADKVASGEYSIETASLQGDDRFIPSAKQLNVAPSSLEGWRRIAKGGEVRVADTGALVHESTHAYFHIKNSDPTFAGVIAKGIEHYRDAPLVGGGVANDPERIFQEAVAGYVEHRIISYARTRDQLTDFKHIVDAGELAIPSEELSGMLDKLASDYDKDQADLTFGYENQYGWSGKNQVYTTRDLSPELSNFLDENVLEGSIAHHFSDSKELTALMTSIRERLAAPAAQPGRRAQ